MQTFARNLPGARRVCSPDVAQNPEQAPDGRQETANRPLPSVASTGTARPARRGVGTARLPGFGIRISDTKDADPARRGKAGKITFILYARFAPGAAPTRRTIGIYGAMTLEEARRIAGEWRCLIAKGIDPAVVEAEAREKAEPVSGRCGSSIPSPPSPRRSSPTSWRRSAAARWPSATCAPYFIAAWGERPVSEITKLDVLEIINTKKRSAHRRWPAHCWS